MDKLHWIYGFLLGLTTTLLGSFIFIEAFTDYGFSEGVKVLQYEGLLGRLVKLGALLNIGVFFLLLKFKKDEMAKGIIAAVIFLAIMTFFV
ncbi:hypothetical protein [Flavobacterium sp. 3HN19-14]|uniref:hypothetical protein n=1 Tax=Flavobacterium sp. 3HN19-14 TaxID=3448133 RepID=UPI003EE4100B